MQLFALILLLILDKEYFAIIHCCRRDSVSKLRKHVCWPCVVITQPVKHLWVGGHDPASCNLGRM